MAHSVGCSRCCCSCGSSRADAEGAAADEPAAGIVVVLACDSNWENAQRTVGKAAACLAGTRSGDGEGARGADFGVKKPDSDADWDGCDWIDCAGAADCAGSFWSPD